jgi:coproporphyrinogen III oxidase-like Fe-S oxidoreductase
MALNEYIMLALRSKGLDLHDFEQKFGSSWILQKKDLLTKLLEQKLISANNKFISLTPEGYALCDEILSKIL